MPGSNNIGFGAPRAPHVHAGLCTGLCCALLLLLSGCVLAPAGMGDEQRRVDEAGGLYAERFEERELPELPERPEWQHVLHRAFWANGGLEAAYHDWSAAMARVQQAATWPNAPLRLRFEYMFSSDGMKAWNRTTIGGDLEGTEFPTKTARAGRVALADARAAGHRFAGAKFDLQRRVLNAWIDYALMEQMLRIQRDNVQVLRLLADTAEVRVRAGGPQQDFLKAQIEHQLADNELQTIQSQLPQMRAMLNAMLARPADAPLPPPEQIPGPRAIPAEDARLLAVGVFNSPELAALARQVEGRQDALERARMEFIPDISPMAAITGNVSQMIGAMVMVPTTIPRINGMIKEARSELRGMEAMRRQSTFEAAGSFVGTLYMVRNAERQVALFHDRILPAAEMVLAAARQSYTAGTVTFIELIDSQRTLLDVKLMIAEARAAREKALADLEALAGVDIETLSAPAAAPATQPAAP
jgi:outer membrane protein, heavy metal efflux system